MIKEMQDIDIGKLYRASDNFRELNQTIAGSQSCPDYLKIKV